MRYYYCTMPLIHLLTKSLIGAVLLMVSTVNVHSQIVDEPGEEFFLTPFDLAFKQITFSPFEDPNTPGRILYSVTVKDITELPESDFGNSFNRSGDDESDTFELETPFPFFGVEYTEIYINSNGTLNFDTASTDLSGSLLSHSFKKQIAAFWTDLDTGGHGAIYQKETGSSYVYTWDDVAEFGNSSARVNCQVELYHDGRIIISYTEVNIADFVVVGISSGQGNSDVVDFSAAPENATPYALILSNIDIDENLPAGTVVGTIVPVDPDFGDTHTYHFIAPGTGSEYNRYFNILNGNQLVTTLQIDFEKDPVLTCRLRVTDSVGNTLTSVLNVTVNDLIGEDTDADGQLDIEEIFLGTSIFDPDDNKPVFSYASVAPSDSGEDVILAQFERATSQSRVSAVGKWSRDLKNWYTSDQTDPQGVTVRINENPTGQGDPEIVNVDLDVMTGTTDRLFYKMDFIDNQNP
jgi:hypothetical protein